MYTIFNALGNHFTFRMISQISSQQSLAFGLALSLFTFIRLLRNTFYEYKIFPKYAIHKEIVISLHRGRQPGF